MKKIIFFVLLISTVSCSRVPEPIEFLLPLEDAQSHKISMRMQKAHIDYNLRILSTSKNEQFLDEVQIDFKLTNKGDEPIEVTVRSRDFKEVEIITLEASSSLTLDRATIQEWIAYSHLGLWLYSSSKMSVDLSCNVLENSRSDLKGDLLIRCVAMPTR